MSTPRTLAFAKMNGLGNDFVIIDARDTPLALSADEVRLLAGRDHPATKGCDQLLVIHAPRRGGDAFMQIFNADGGEVEACGNGARAVAAFLAQHGHAEARLETLGGLLACRSETDGKAARVSIDMPRPEIGAPLALHDALPAALPVDVGNPHGVLFVDGGTAEKAAQYGPELERHAAFPHRANINFATLAAPQTLRLDTWERGAGLTLACGTGACATAAAAVHQGLCDAGDVHVRPPFNRDDNDADIITVTVQPGRSLTMRGPAAFEFAAETTL